MSIQEWSQKAAKVWQVAWRRGGYLPEGFVQHAALLTTANLVTAGLQLVQGVIVARLLGPSQYGIIALVVNYVGILYLLLEARTAEGSTKYLAEFDATAKRELALAVCKLGYVIDLAISTIVFLLVLATGWWAEKNIVKVEGTLPLIVLYGAALIPRSLKATSYASLTVSGRFRTIGWLQIAGTTVQVVAILLFLTSGFGVAGVIYGYFVEALFSGLLYTVIAHRIIQSRWGGSWLNGSWGKLRGRYREIFRFYVLTDFNVLIQTVLTSLDVTIIGFFRTPTEAGYYKLAKTTAESINLVINPLRAVIYPEMSRSMHTGDRSMSLRWGLQLSAQIGLPIALFATLLVGAAPVLMPLAFGEKFIPSVFAFQGIAIAWIINSVFWWLRSCYYSAGLVGQWSVIVLVADVVALALWLILTPRLGYLAVAWTWPLLAALSHGMAIYRYIRTVQGTSRSRG